MKNSLVLLICFAAVSCGQETPGSAAHDPAEPVSTVHIANESELLELTLTEAAERRLGLQTTRVSMRAESLYRQLGAEILVAPITPDAVPVDSRVNLQQLGAQQFAADAAVAQAEAQKVLGEITLARNRAMLRDEAGSERARDEALAALAIADAALAAAQGQRGLLGPEVGSLSTATVLWARVPIFSSDIPTLQLDAPARVHALGNGGAAVMATPVVAPPSANAGAGTVDAYYALDNNSVGFLVGQRVAIDVPLTLNGEYPVVADSAIVRDIYGGEWVYSKTAPRTFLRKRVEVLAQRDGTATIVRGLSAGDEVVTAGAAELFGTEFGAGH